VIARRSRQNSETIVTIVQPTCSGSACARCTSVSATPRRPAALPAVAAFWAANAAGVPVGGAQIAKAVQLDADAPALIDEWLVSEGGVVTEGKALLRYSSGGVSRKLVFAEIGITQDQTGA
jgi:hypothetical protein